MPTMTTRPYAGAADLQAMIDLLRETRTAERRSEYPGEIDLREMLATSQVQRNTGLWIDLNARLAGFALVDAFNNLWFEVAPSATGYLEARMIEWGAERLRRASHAGSKPITLDTNCDEDNTQRIALLEQQGFVLQPIRTLRMTRSLAKPIAIPQLPAGFAIRPVASEHEVEALVTLHRAAFGTEHLTIEERLAMMRTPEYDPALDLITVAPDGAFAAYCLCTISVAENARTGRKEGHTDPVAVHPNFQQRGLAHTLLLTGLHLLKQRGMDTAVLGTSSENIAMQRAAMSAGFCVQSTKVWFSRPVFQN